VRDKQCGFRIPHSTLPLAPCTLDRPAPVSCVSPSFATLHPDPRPYTPHPTPCTPPSAPFTLHTHPARTSDVHLALLLRLAQADAGAQVQDVLGCQGDGVVDAAALSPEPCAPQVLGDSQVSSDGFSGVL